MAPALGTITLTPWVLRPITRMASQASTLDPDGPGDLGELDRADELGQLARARAAVWPQGKPQERVLNAAPFLARYGPPLLEQVRELHLAPRAARLDVREHLLEIAHARRERLHLAQPAMHAIQPLAHELEGFAEALFERALQLLVDGDAIDSRKSGGYSLKPGALDRASAGFALFVLLSWMHLKCIPLLPDVIF